jgi:hypothetical protein
MLTKNRLAEEPSHIKQLFLTMCIKKLSRGNLVPQVLRCDEPEVELTKISCGLIQKTGLANKSFT